MKNTIMFSALLVGIFGFIAPSHALEGSKISIEDAYKTRGGQSGGRIGLRRYSDDTRRTIYRRVDSSRALENPFRSRTQSNRRTSIQKKLRGKDIENIKDKVGKKKTPRISIRTRFNNPVGTNAATSSGQRNFDEGVTLRQAYERSNRRRNLQPGVASLTRERSNRNTFTHPRNSTRNQGRRRSFNNRISTTRQKANRRSFLEQKFNRYRPGRIGGSANQLSE